MATYNQIYRQLKALKERSEPKENLCYDFLRFLLMADGAAEWDILRLRYSPQFESMDNLKQVIRANDTTKAWIEFEIFDGQPRAYVQRLLIDQLIVSLNELDDPVTICPEGDTNLHNLSGNELSSFFEQQWRSLSADVIGRPWLYVQARENRLFVHTGMWAAVIEFCDGVGDDDNILAASNMELGHLSVAFDTQLRLIPGIPRKYGVLVANLFDDSCRRSIRSLESLSLVPIDGLQRSQVLLERNAGSDHNQRVILANLPYLFSICRNEATDSITAACRFKEKLILSGLSLK